MSIIIEDRKGHRRRTHSAAPAATKGGSIPQLFRYYGSKARMTDAIAALVPSDCKVLVSLFMGSGVFEYNYAKDHPDCRVVCFDIDPAVVNFHQHALKKRVALHAAIVALSCSEGTTDMDKEKYDRLMAEHRASRHRGLSAAARFYLLAAYSYNGKFGSFAAKPFRQPLGLLHELPKNLSVQVGDALQVLERGEIVGESTTCLYLDPPYMYEKKKNYYTANAFDHDGLSALLLVSDHKWILSYNDAPSVRRLYRKKPILSLPISYTYYSRGGSRKDACVAQKAELIVCSSSSTMTPRSRKLVRELFDRNQAKQPTSSS